jgi:pectate lyase
MKIKLRKNQYSVGYLFILLVFCFGTRQLLGQSGSEHIYRITDFGAIGDAKTINTAAIQKAIDAANANGGGKVVIPEGKFLSGTLQMKTGVEMHLDNKAVLLGSTNPRDYHKIDRPGHPVSPKQDDNSSLALIAAFKADHFSITGTGTIDGQGTALALNIDSLIHIGQISDPHYSNRPNEKVRPKLLLFSLCQNINIEDASLKNSACWGLSFEICEHLTLNNLKVTNMAYWNNDGTDLTDCKNVRITNCDFNTADDGICLKSYYPGYFDDSFYIANCRIRSGASAIKFGTASYGGFKNIVIDNINICDTYRSAIAIESVDGGVIENVHVTHINAKNTGNAIFIRLGHRAGKEVGSIKNVYIGNVKVEIPFGRPDVNYDLRAPEPGFHNPFPASITGIPGHNVQNIQLENIEITYPGRASKAQAYFSLSRLNDLPEKTRNYPEFTMFGELPAWGFYIRHASNIAFKNITLKLAGSDFRPSFVIDSARHVTLSHIQLPTGYQDGQIILKDSPDYMIEASGQLHGTVL